MVSVQKEVLEGVGLLARLHAVLHVNSNALMFEEGGVKELVVFDTGITTKTSAKTSMTSAIIIITITETGNSCPFILLGHLCKLNCYPFSNLVLGLYRNSPL